MNDFSSTLKRGVPRKVAEEFVKHDRGKNIGKLPPKVGKKKP